LYKRRNLETLDVVWFASSTGIDVPEITSRKIL
jgi:hypothetical protein